MSLKNALSSVKKTAFELVIPLRRYQRLNIVTMAGRPLLILTSPVYRNRLMAAIAAARNYRYHLIPRVEQPIKHAYIHTTVTSCDLTLTLNVLTFSVVLSLSSLSCYSEAFWNNFGALLLIVRSLRLIIRKHVPFDLWTDLDLRRKPFKKKVIMH